MTIKTLTKLPVSRIAAIGTTAVLLAGCADDNARIVALNTMKVSASYEMKLDEKIKAENKFYRDQLDNLWILMAGVKTATDCATDQQAASANASTHNDAEAKKCIGPNFKKGWLYGRIMTAANKDSRETAGRLLSTKDGEILTAISRFVGRGVAVNRGALQEVRAQRATLTNRIATALLPIEKQKARLKALRKGLTTLSEKSDFKARFGQIQKIAKTVLDTVNSTKSEP